MKKFSKQIVNRTLGLNLKARGVPTKVTDSGFKAGMWVPLIVGEIVCAWREAQVNGARAAHPDLALLSEDTIALIAADAYHAQQKPTTP